MTVKCSTAEEKVHFTFMSKLKLFYFHYLNSKLITVNIKLEIGSKNMAEVHFSHLQDF